MRRSSRKQDSSDAEDIDRKPPAGRSGTPMPIVCNDLTCTPENPAPDWRTETHWHSQTATSAGLARLQYFQSEREAQAAIDRDLAQAPST
ncbi:unnamed protein product, partial [Ectocarpus sp. 8 AP-2014]